MSFLKKTYMLELKDDNNVPFQVLLKLTEEELYQFKDKVNCYNVKDSNSYYIPQDPPKNPKMLYWFLLWQDIKRGKVFNSNRNSFYLMVKQQYGFELTSKEKQIVEEYKNYQDDEVENLNISGFENLHKTNIKIILLSSRTANIGKSTLADTLVKELPDSSKTSFANAIRFSVADTLNNIGIDKDIFEPEYYTKTKGVKTKHDESFNKFVTRDLLCDFSDVIQIHLGEQCWAKAMVSTITELNTQYIIIDDLRRNIELEYLQSVYGKENIVSVYLDKEDVNPIISKTANNYEGQVNPDTYTIKFTFNKDWSNTDQLISQIKETVQ